MRKVVSAQEMRAVEKGVMERGTSLQDLIEIAGAAVANAADELANGGQVVVLAGPGNNGSDGLVAAEILRRGGRSVSVYGFRRAGPGIYEGALVNAEDDAEHSALRNMLSGGAVVVDALLGIGQTRPPEGMLASILGLVQSARAPDAATLAVDIPTGVNADTGAVPGPAVRADVTLCMGYLKRGVILDPGRFYAGKTRVADLDIPEDLDTQVRVSVPEAADISRIVPVRSPNSNKGTYGRLTIVGGSAAFVGAPALVANGAYRAGAGLVELALPTGIVKVVSGHTLESVFTSLPEEDGRISPSAATVLEPQLRKASAVVFGPGMGVSDATREFTANALRAIESAGVKAALIDADGLNSLAQLDGWWETQTPLVLTPHPGEMSRLTGRSVSAIQSNRIETAMHYAARWGKVVVLKGSGTVVAGPTGRASINPTGGPNLSTAGTGDVLSGIIGGLLAQGCSPWDAAVAGVYIHGAAGDLVGARYGDAGTIASDLFAAIPQSRSAILQEAGVES